MIGLIKRWKERRAQRQKLKDLSAFASAFSTLEQLSQSGLLAWDEKECRLFIDRSLAVVMMRNAESWQNFISNVFLWQYSRLCDRAWADFIQKEELAAVRNHMQEHNNEHLSQADIDKIREARRMEIVASDLSAPKIVGFEFFVTSPPASDSNALARLLSVGYYDPATDRMEMALWKDIENYMRT